MIPAAATLLPRRRGHITARARQVIAPIVVSAFAALTGGSPTLFQPAYAGAGLTAAIAADPVREDQWHLGFLHVAEAHAYGQGEGIVVGVVDSGVDATHPDLTENVLAGRDFTGTSADGRVDVDGHGTAMAGLIAANGRALGIAPKAKILPLRDTVGGHFGAASTAIDWGIDNGVRVLSLSFVASDTSDLKEAIERAVANDVVVVAGVGNQTEFSSLDFPAGYPGVVGVAGVDKDGSHAGISKVSRFADLAAPAVDIWSTNTRANGGEDYRAGTGTSDATAIVAGAAALVRAKYPNLSAAEVVNRLTATADDKGAPGRDDEYGYGVINLVKALTADVPLLTPTATPPTTSNQAAPQSDGNGFPTGTVILIGAAILLLLAAGAVAIVRRQRDS